MADDEDPNRSHPRSRRESEDKRGSIPRGSASNSGYPFARRGSLAVPLQYEEGEEEEEEEEEEVVEAEMEEEHRVPFMERLDTQDFQQLAGMAPSHLSMPEPFPGMDAAQYGLFGALEHQVGSMFQPQPVLSSSSFQLQEEGFHGPYARDDPRYMGSHVDPNYGPFDFELPEPDPRELMIQNAKAYLLLPQCLQHPTSCWTPSFQLFSSPACLPWSFLNTL